jgi:hypothetical protein
MDAESRPRKGALPDFGKALLWTLLVMLSAHAIPYVVTGIRDSSSASVYLTFTCASPGVMLTSLLGIDPKVFGHALSTVIVLGTAWTLTRDRILGGLTLVVVGIGSGLTSLGLASALLA